MNNEQNEQLDFHSPVPSINHPNTPRYWVGKVQVWNGVRCGMWTGVELGQVWNAVGY